MTVDLDTAQQLLRLFTEGDRLPPQQLSPHDQVRQALHQVREHSDYQIFGICAAAIADATTSLKAYLAALGYDAPGEIPTVEGAVYVKYNPKTGRCHVDSYIGEYRGVLVSCQSEYDGDVNETFGHLPLDLFSQA